MRRTIHLALLLMLMSGLLFFSAAQPAQASVLLQQHHLNYEGAFRVPGGGQGFGYSGYALSFNPANNSLFLASIYRQTVAEISIPTPLKASSISGLNVAGVLQPWSDPTEGNRTNVRTDGSSQGGSGYIGATLPYGNRLLGGTYFFYDAGGGQYLSHWDRSINLSATGTFRGNYRFGEDTFHPAMKAGYMTHVPAAYQGLLGGDVLSGKGLGSIATTTSFGPAVYVFKGNEIGVKSPIPATMLLGYPTGEGRRTLGDYINDGPANPYVSTADEIHGVVFPENSKSVLFFGRHGTGSWCYKETCTGPLYPSPPGGVAARPYVYFAWAYNIDDLIAVKTGHKVTQADYNSNRFWTGVYPNNSTLSVGQTVRPWNVVPYAKWTLDLPYDNNGDISGRMINGAAYDPATQKIYLSQKEMEGMDKNPVIHVYSLNLEAGAPPVDTTPPVRSNGSPTGTLSAGTTQAVMSLATNENATCRWAASSGTAYASMPNTFTTTGGTSHSTTLTGLQNGGSYNRHVRCVDSKANANTNDYAISFSIAESSDNTPPPALSNGFPTGTLSAGTTQTMMGLTTNKSATCRWAASSGTAYASMPNTFTTTGGTSHSTTLTGLQNGGTYNRHVRCVDGNGNATANDFTISFSIQTSNPTGGRIVNVGNLSQLYTAFSNQQSGDEIVIAPGTYTLNSTALAVNVSNLVIRGATGDSNDVVIRGDAMTSSATIKSIFYFQRGAYGQNTTIKDMSIGRVGWHAVFFNGNGSGNGSTFDNVRFFDSYQQIIKGTVVDGVGTSNVTVKNSLFEYTAGVGPQWYIGGIDSHHANGWIIQDNEFRNIKSPSGKVAEHAIHLWSGTSFSGSNLIERNKIINCDRGIGIWNGTGTNIIRNNMVMHDGSGAFPDVGIDIQNTPNTQVYNNTVWIAPSGYYAAIEFRGASTSNSLAVNNLTNKQIAVFAGVSGTFQSNVSNAQASWFVDVSSNLRLSNAVSSVVGQGQAVAGLSDDFDGYPRVGSIDIGAHQFYFTGSPLSPPTGLKIISSM